MVVNSNVGSWCITFHKRVDNEHSMLCVGNLRENIVCNNLTYISLRGKCCFCIEMYRSFQGLRPLDPLTQGLCPWTPPYAGPWTPRRKAHAPARFDFLHFAQALLAMAPSYPLPTGTLEKSRPNATVFPVSHARLFTIFDLGRNSCAYVLHRFEFKTFVIIWIMSKLYSFNFIINNHPH